MLRFAVNGGGSLRNRNRQTSRKIGGGNEVTAVSRDAADSDEPSGLAGERLGDDADAPVGRNHDVEVASRDCGIKRLAKMRVGVNVLDVGADLRNFVRATMKNRHLVAALAHAVYEKRSARTRAADD